jgi:hypothetical protein
MSANYVCSFSALPRYSIFRSLFFNFPAQLHAGIFALTHSLPFVPMLDYQSSPCVEVDLFICIGSKRQLFGFFPFSDALVQSVLRI